MKIRDCLKSAQAALTPSFRKASDPKFQDLADQFAKSVYLQVLNLMHRKTPLDKIKSTLKSHYKGIVTLTDDLLDLVVEKIRKDSPTAVKYLG